MELLQLQYFYDSAQNENFSKTAEKYMVPVSSVSAAVKRLEKELGVALFDRTANRIELNRNGRLLADALHSAFEQVNGAIEAMSSEKPKNTEIRMLIRARRKWITDLIIEYTKAHPNVTFCVTNDFDREDFDSFDVIIDGKSEIYGDLEQFLLSVEQICIKAARNSEFVGKALTMRQLKEAPFVMMGEGSAMRRLLDKAAKRCGFEPRVAIECDDRQCLFRCVEAGMGLTLGSRRALRDAGEENIVSLNVTDFHEIQLVYVYHRKAGDADGALQDFLAYLLQRSQLQS